MSRNPKSAGAGRDVLVVLFARGIHGLAGAYRAGRGVRNSGFVLVIEESGKPHRCRKQILPANWVKQATSPSELNPQYGLMWWLYTWNGHEIYAARDSEGHLIVVVPDQKSVTAISSGNRQEYP